MSRKYAENLRRIREERGLSVAQLSEKSGLSKWKIRSIQRGEFFGADDVTRIVKALDCSCMDLLGF